MALLVLLCMLMTVSSTFGEDCGCNPQPPVYPPGPNPPASLPCNYSKINYDQVVDKQSVRKEYVNIYLLTTNGVFLNPYNRCSLRNPGYGCWTYYIVKIIIDLFFGFIIQVFTKTGPIRGLPGPGEPFPFWFPYTQISLRSCPGNKFCGSGACLSEGGIYYNPGICYAYQDPLSQYGLSSDCKTTICAYKFDDDKLVLVDDRGATYLGPSLSWAQRDPQAAANFVRDTIQMDSYAATVEALQSSIANYPFYSNFSDTCEISYPDKKSYFSNCGILQSDPEKYP